MIAGSALLSALALVASLHGPASEVDEVRAAERAWLDAYRHLDTAAMAALLADGFTITHPDGRVTGREALLGEIERMRAGGRRGPSLTARNVCARQHGAVVILTGTVAMQGPGGASRLSRYTDTYVRANGAWRVAASHLSGLDNPDAAPACD